MKTSIVICTYNEEKTITNVVSLCCQNNPDAEIIVVDDGSSDNTELLLTELQHKYNFRYEKLNKNMGKSWAMVHGVELAANEIILFFDADVTNIQKEHFEKLLNPIINKQADMVLGQPSETLIDYRINPFRPLTGQRALLKKDIVPILDDIRNVRFGVETYLNLYYQANGKKLKYVLLEGLSHPTKYQKTTPVTATKEFIKEGHEIALTLINNYDLITQRVEFQLKHSNKTIIDKLDKLQLDINNKLHELKNRFDKNFE